MSMGKLPDNNDRLGRYDSSLQMFVDAPRDPDEGRLLFLKFLAERGEVGPSSGRPGAVTIRELLDGVPTPPAPPQGPTPEPPPLYNTMLPPSVPPPAYTSNPVLPPPPPTGNGWGYGPKHPDYRPPCNPLDNHPDHRGGMHQPVDDGPDVPLD